MEPDHVGTVLKLLSDRRQQIVEQRITAVNRLHQLLADLFPGGAARRLTPVQACLLLATERPRDQIRKARGVLRHPKPVAAGWVQRVWCQGLQRQLLDLPVELPQQHTAGPATAKDGRCCV